MFRRCSISLAIFLTVLLTLGQTDQPSVESIVSALRSQHNDEALAAADAALRSNPKNFRIWTLKGMALSRKGQVPDALKAYQSALALSPGNLGVLRAEASLLFDAQDQRAIPVLENIVKADAADRTAHEMLAVAQARKDSCSAALLQFAVVSDALASHPNSLQWYGYCLMREKRYAESTNVFQQLVTLFPERPDARYDLALTQNMAGKNADAVQTLQSLLSAKPPDPDVLSLASEAYEAIGDTPTAVSLLRQAIILDPGNPDLYVRFAGLCLSHDSYQVGVDMIDAGMKHISNSASLYIARGLLYGQLEQYEKADTDFETADRLNPHDSVAAHALAATEIESGDLRAAQKSIERKLADHPKDASLQFTLAKILIDRGAKPGSTDFRRAMDSALTAARLNPDLTPAHDLLAGMYLQQGQTALAAQQSRIALKTDPSDQSSLYHLIEALRKSGNTTEVQALVQRLLRLQRTGSVSESGRKQYKIIEQNQTAP